VVDESTEAFFVELISLDLELSVLIEEVSIYPDFTILADVADHIPMDS
jgi:hypothetical protein